MNSFATAYMPIFTIVPPKKKTILWAVAILSIVVLILIPIIVEASGLGGYNSEKLIERSGVSDSQLIVGRDGVSNSSQDIAMGGIHINPSSTLYKLTALLPLFFTVLVLYLLLKMFASGNIDAKTLIIIVIFISLATAFIVTVQGGITNLLK